MKNKPWLKTLSLCCLLIALLTSAVASANDSSEQQSANENQQDDFTWQMMIGASVVYDPSIFKGVEDEDFSDYLGLSIVFDVYYKGFFIQANKRRASGLYSGAELGYQIESNEQWGLDVLTKAYIGSYSPSDLIEQQDKPIPTMEGLGTRQSADGLALRYSYYGEQSVLSIDFASTAINSSVSGWLIESFYSKLIPYRNWDIYYGVGLTYYSSDIVDNYIGIDADEVSPVRAEYHASGAFLAQFEINALYPISENWTLNAGIIQNFYSNKITDSPLVAHANLTQALIGFVYVF